MKTINLTIAFFLISFSFFAQTGPRVSPSTSTSSSGGRTGEGTHTYLLFERLILTNQELSFKIQKSDSCSKIIGVYIRYANEKDGGNIKFKVLDRSIYNLKPQESIIDVKVKLDEIIHNKKIICTIRWNLDGCNDVTAKGPFKNTKNQSFAEAAEIKEDDKSKGEQAIQVQYVNKVKSNAASLSVTQAQQARQADVVVKHPVTVTKVNTTEVWGLHIFQQDIAIPTKGTKNN
jgi:hypothetical protein